jgi:hypothetical protein
MSEDLFSNGRFSLCATRLEPRVKRCYRADQLVNVSVSAAFTVLDRYVNDSARWNLAQRGKTTIGRLLKRGSLRPTSRGIARCA